MKHLLIILLLLCSVSVSAQDIIVKKDGSRVPCRVVNVTATEINYSFNGTNYVMDKSLASEIDYENGKVEVFDKTENMYKPYNQNDGVQQYNDKALLELDAASQSNLNKMKVRNTFRWVGGSILTAGTALWTAALIAVSFDSDTDWDASAIAVFGVFHFLYIISTIEMFKKYCHFHFFII